MGLPVTVYRYTDAGAPQLVNNTPSEWINVLKKVLVEGYGDKQPLGWTLEFEDTGVRAVAFRNSTTDGGSGGYVKFYSIDGSNTVNRILGIKCSIGMTDINTFLKPLWSRGFVTFSSYTRWEIIGTKRGFYLILHKNSDLLMGLEGASQDSQVYFIGDIHSVIQNDTSPFTIVTSTSTLGDNTNSTGITEQSSNLYAQLYATDGSSTFLNHTFEKGSLYKSINTDGGNAESLSINHLMSPVFVKGVNSQNNNSALPQGRGIVPGLYISSFAGYRNENWPVELIDNNGVKMILLRSYATPQIWISAGYWYD